MALPENQSATTLRRGTSWRAPGGAGLGAERRTSGRRRGACARDRGNRPWRRDFDWLDARLDPFARGLEPQPLYRLGWAHARGAAKARLKWRGLMHTSSASVSTVQ